MLRFIQITDLHVAEPDKDTFQVDTRANFRKIFEEANKLKPNYLLLTGDFCFRGVMEETYHWIFDKLGNIDIPKFFIAGNHDSSEILARKTGNISHLHDGYLYFSRKIGDDKWLFLDTSKGLMEDAQLEWLSREIADCRDRAFICMHHPPFPAGVPHMDGRYAFQTPASFRETLLIKPDVEFFIYSGHYHVERSLVKDNMNVFITPSCFVQIDDRFEDFQIDHKQIALRIIDVHHDHVSTSVRYYDGAVQS